MADPLSSTAGEPLMAADGTPEDADCAGAGCCGPVVPDVRRYVSCVDAGARVYVHPSVRCTISNAPVASALIRVGGVCHVFEAVVPATEILPGSQYIESGLVECVEGASCAATPCDTNQYVLCNRCAASPLTCPARVYVLASELGGFAAFMAGACGYCANGGVVPGSQRLPGVPVVVPGVKKNSCCALNLFGGSRSCYTHTINGQECCCSGGNDWSVGGSFFHRLVMFNGVVTCAVSFSGQTATLVTTDNRDGANVVVTETTQLGPTSCEDGRCAAYANQTSSYYAGAGGGFLVQRNITECVLTQNCAGFSTNYGTYSFDPFGGQIFLHSTTAGGVVYTRASSGPCTACGGAAAAGVWPDQRGVVSAGDLL